MRIVPTPYLLVEMVSVILVFPGSSLRLLVPMYDLLELVQDEICRCRSDAPNINTLPFVFDFLFIRVQIDLLARYSSIRAFERCVIPTNRLMGLVG